MKKIILILSITLASILTCNSQNIEMRETNWGYKFTQNGEKFSIAEATKRMESNKNAYKFMKKAKSNNFLAEILGSTGGACIGFAIGTAIADGNPNWTLAGIGAGLLAISIPISSKVNKDVKKAIDLYNTNLNSATYKTKPEFKIIGNRKGVGIVMNFQ